MRVLPMRRLIPAAAIAAAVGVAGVLTAAAGGALSWANGLVLAGVVLCLAALAVIGAAVLRIHAQQPALGKLLAADARRASQIGVVGEAVDRLHRSVDDAAGRSAEHDRGETARLAALEARLDALEASVRDTSSRLEKSVADGFAVSGRDVAQVYWQVEALLDLRALLEPRAPLPPLRSWAASPDAIQWLVERLWATRPSLIVECGSGVSSILLGYAVQKLGTGRIVALEHDKNFADESMRRLRDHGLEDVVEVRYAPLTPWRRDGDDREWLWYDVEALKDLEGIGLVFVDGPPGDLGPLARYPAVPALLPHASSEVVFALDDANRPDEWAVSSRWTEELTGYERLRLRKDKGLHIFQPAAAPLPSVPGAESDPAPEPPE